MSAGGDAAPDGGRPDSGWRRHRRRSRPPWGRMAVAGLFLLAVFGGWWWFARGAGTRPATAGVASTGAVPAVDTSTADSASTEPVVPSSAPELRWSVLVASFAGASGAREQAEAWAGDGLYLVAPTAVDGTTYWRLYRGAVSDRSAAEAINRGLVERGRKSSASRWDVRPARLAFRIDVHRGRAAASSRAEALRADGVPAYLVRAAVGGDTVWQVYAGAYEARTEAAPLRERLREAGVDAELVTRRGEPSDR